MAGHEQGGRRKPDEDPTRPEHFMDPPPRSPRDVKEVAPHLGEQAIRGKQRQDVEDERAQRLGRSLGDRAVKGAQVRERQQQALGRAALSDTVRTPLPERTSPEKRTEPERPPEKPER